MINQGVKKVSLGLFLAGFLLFVAPVHAAVGDVFADVRNLKLTYAIYLGGLHVMDSSTEYTRSGPIYSIAMQAGTKGLAEVLIPWDADLNSTGRMKDENVLPQKSVITTRWKKKPESVEFSYVDGRDIKAVFTPDKKEMHEAVPEDMKKDSIDPLTGIVQLMANFAYGKGCAQTVPIYDGHRRFDVEMREKGQQNLNGEDYSIFSGTAEKCQIDFAMKAGSRKDREGSKFWEGKDGNNRPPVYVYLANVRNDLPALPVRAETDTPFGAVMIHLTAVEGASAKLASKP
jgi:hypothetical protein